MNCFLAIFVFSILPCWLIVVFVFVFICAFPLLGSVPLLAFGFWGAREGRVRGSFRLGSALVGLGWDLELECAREIPRSEISPGPP